MPNFITDSGEQVIILGHHPGHVVLHLDYRDVWGSTKCARMLLTPEEAEDIGAALIVEAKHKLLRG